MFQMFIFFSLQVTTAVVVKKIRKWKLGEFVSSVYTKDNSNVRSIFIVIAVFLLLS